MIGNVPFIVVAILAGIGMYGIIFKRNIIKMVIGLTILESGVNLFLITTGYREGGIAPIFTNAIHDNMVLPTPQALTLTSIVIGVAVTALILSIVIVLYRKYKTLDTKKLTRLKG